MNMIEALKASNLDSAFYRNGHNSAVVEATGLISFAFILSHCMAGEELQLSYEGQCIKDEDAMNNALAQLAPADNDIPLSKRDGWQSLHLKIGRSVKETGGFSHVDNE